MPVFAAKVLATVRDGEAVGAQGKRLDDILTLTIGVLACFQVKHFVADYLLQPPWLIRGKGHFGCAGGYVHAGIHAVGSIPALLLAGLPFGPLLMFLAAEFVIHFAIDHIKARISMGSEKGPTTASYWALHGADQLIHQLTYLAMTALAIGWTMPA